MKILIEMHHPAHVHFFKYPIRRWLNEGCEVRVIGRDRDVMQALFRAYDWIPVVHLTRAQRGRKNQFPVIEMLKRQISVAREVWRLRPDVVLSLMGSYTQWAGIWGCPNIVFTDSEFQHFNHRMAHPFADRIFTPDSFKKDLGKKQRRYPGYHELAFLHPHVFSPREEVKGLLGLAKEEAYIVVRLSAWDTLHDVGEAGWRKGDVARFLEKASKKYRIFIVPEGGVLPVEWESMRFNLDPSWFHDALAFARFVITEGASTASEAACLGVPALFINSVPRSYVSEQATVYGLTQWAGTSEAGSQIAERWLDQPPSLEEAQKQRMKLLEAHIDVSDWVATMILERSWAD